MKDVQRSEGTTHDHASAIDSEAVSENVAGFSCHRIWSPRWLLQRLKISLFMRLSTSNQLMHRLDIFRRTLKRIVCGFPTFYWLHVAYYGALTVAGTMLLWWCRAKESISVVDCIFNAVSALTTTGLSSVLLRDFTTLGLFTLLVLMLLGNTVFVSLLPVYVRRFQFFPRNQALNTSESGVNLDFPRCTTCQGRCDEYQTSDASQVRMSPQAGNEYSRWLEHQALITLSWLVPIYMFILVSFGFVAIICYTSFTSKGASRIRALYDAQDISPTFTAIFLSVSAFSNTGLSPLDENMVPFAASPLVLIPLAILILAGNTMFPPSLRFILWGLRAMKRTDDPQRGVYNYLLQCPRRCYTHLFPQVQTTWLVVTVLAFNTVDLVAFCTLEWNSAAVAALPNQNAGAKLMDGLFQSLNTRSSGMNVLQMSNLSPPLLVLYSALMCFAAYPVFLTRQHTRLPRIDFNQLHQDSDLDVAEKVATKDADDNKLSMQYRKLLMRDSAYIFVQIFLVCTVEMRSISSDPLNYSIFSIVFEVISAYGNVGLSLGYSCEHWVRATANTTPQLEEAAAACQNVPYSFSGKWSVGSKLILVTSMLLGRHRSLPDDIDSAMSF